jgi:hypothetical protein
MDEKSCLCTEMPAKKFLTRKNTELVIPDGKKRWVKKADNFFKTLQMAENKAEGNALTGGPTSKEACKVTFRGKETRKYEQRISKVNVWVHDVEQVRRKIHGKKR